MDELRDTILLRKHDAEIYLADKRLVWDKAEELFHNQLNDSVSDDAKSNIFDPKLATLTIERGYRVMSQLPVGKVKAISKNDMGGSQLMNLVLDKYVIPNANAQFDFLTKMRMSDIYSNVYGNFFSLTDWDVKPNGYVGPDVWLLNIRDVFPQVGAVSLDDSDYIIVRTWKPLSYFESIAKQKGYKNIGKIIEQLKDMGGSKGKRDSDSTSKREEAAYTDKIDSKPGFYEVLTMYEKDRWVDFNVETQEVFRDIDNPHDNGELPVDCKYSIPLLDDFMGFSDFERGGSMQMVVNSAWNLWLDSVKQQIFPPVAINKDAIAQDSSIKWGAAEKWLFRTGQAPVGNAVSPINLSPKGIDTFNNAYQIANASLLNLFGTTDTTVTQQTEAGFGKTPDALKMQQQRENTRDNADRFYMEQYLKKVMKKMVNLVVKKQSGAITIRLFEPEIEELARGYEDIKDMWDEKTGKLSIGKKQFGSTLYDYEIVSGSTYANDQKAQQDNLQMLLGLYLQSQTPQGNMLVSDLDRDGFILKFGELFKRVISNSGIQDWDKILVEKTDKEKSETIINDNNQILAQAMQQIQGMGQVPPQPGQAPQSPQSPQQVGGLPMSNQPPAI
jgi:hypothetical protein